MNPRQTGVYVLQIEKKKKNPGNDRRPQTHTYPLFFWRARREGEAVLFRVHIYVRTPDFFLDVSTLLLVFFFLKSCRKHRGLIAIELSCSWVPAMVYALILRYREERDSAKIRVKQTFHPLAIRAGRIGAIQIGRLLFATTGVFRVVPPVCPIANTSLAAMFQQKPFPL
jgi:hypothetical protein